MYPTRIKLTQAGLLALLPCLIQSPLVWAEAPPQPLAFYRQLYPESLANDGQHSDALLDRVGYHATLPDAGSTPLTRHETDDLAFNYLWMQQYQGDYRHQNGGAALGAIVRMGLKSLYRSHYGGGTIHAGDGQDDVTSSFSGMDYNLRLNEDRVRLGIEYQF